MGLVEAREHGEHGWFRGGPQSWEHLLDDPLVRDWIDSYTSTSTRQFYLRALDHVLKGCGRTPGELLELPEAEVKVLVKRLAQRYVQRGKHAYGKKLFVVVKSFLESHDRTLLLKRVDRIRVPAKRVEKEHIPGNEEVYRMAGIADAVSKPQNPRNRAIILCLFQSGVRVGCLCRWTYGLVADQLYPEIKPPVRLKITNRLDRKMSGYGLGYYYTFLGREAAESLKEYIEFRKGQGWNPKPSDPLFVTHASVSRGEPLETKGVGELLKLILSRAGIDPETVWVHLIRKAYRKVLYRNPQMPDDMAEALMGHKLNGSKGNYFDHHDIDEIARHYSECNFSSETVSEGEVEELRRKLRELEGKFQHSVNSNDVIVDLPKPIRDEINQIYSEINRKIKDMDKFVQEAVREKVSKYTKEGRPQNCSGGGCAAEAKNGNGHSHKVVGEGELVSHLDEGWEIVKELSDGRMVLRR